MKKRRAIIAVAIALLLCAVAVAAYFLGIWIPNYPREAAYPVRGIDVSRHQGEIDWPSVRGGDIAFVYIKATEGGDFRDAQFQTNWKASATAGLRRGAYHFFTLKTPGAEQAANFIAVVPNDPDALPPAIDLEYWGNSSARPSVPDFQRELSAFIAAVRAHYGREPVFYTANDFKDYYLRDFPISRLWIRSVVTTPRLPKGESWVFWQFSEKTRVPGITGFVDRNVFNGDQKQFDAFINERR